MKIQYCSDLHLEFPENKEYLKENPIVPMADTLVLAGDIVPFAEIERHQDFFDKISEQFKHTYWIPGNHEFYRSDIQKAIGSFEQKIRPNVSLLNNTVKEIEGVNFLFSTLWSHLSPQNEFLISRSLNDFRLITNNGLPFSTGDYNALHRENLRFIKDSLRRLKGAPSVVVTHHVPTFENYPPKYKGSAINEAFAVDLSHLMLEHDIQYWIYGHHHCNLPEFSLGSTKLLTNQLGYVSQGENKEYRQNALLEIS